MLLFICHATEDKKDFVRPLAESLRQNYEVWYDEYQLTLGDSLLQKINEGLASCDFGIVIFSPAFFALSRKWTKAELGGLFALEGTSRKIILPIRKDLTPEELTQFLPTMGDRVSVSASEGVDKVVQEIRLAIDVSERKRQLTIIESATQRLKMLDQTLKEKRDSEGLLSSFEGVGFINEAMNSLFQTLENALTKLEEDSAILKFTFKKTNRDTLYVYGPYRVSIGVWIELLYSNSASQAKLTAKFFLRSRPHYDDEQLRELDDLEFKPAFRSPRQVVWINESDRETYGNEELAGYLIEELTKHIQEQSDDT